MPDQQSLSLTGDTKRRTSSNGTVDSGEIRADPRSSLTDWAELHVLFKFKQMNTCDDEVTMNSRGGYMGLATLTTGGTSAIVARKSQMRPLPTASISAHGKHHDLREVRTPYLSPHQMSKTINPGFVKAQTEQTNEHDEK